MNTDDVGQDVLTLASMKIELDQLKEEVRASTKATEDLVAAWNAAGAVVRFVKWTSSLITALTIVYLAIRHGLGFRPG